MITTSITKVPLAGLIFLMSATGDQAVDEYCRNCDDRCLAMQAVCVPCPGAVFSFQSAETLAGCCDHTIQCQGSQPCSWTGAIKVENSSGAAVTVTIDGPGDPVTDTLADGESAVKFFTSGSGFAPIVSSCTQTGKTAERVAIKVGSCQGEFKFTCNQCPDT